MNLIQILRWWQNLHVPLEWNKILQKELSEGKKIALVSDAGTPMISDPGSVLIKELRKSDIKITSIPLFAKATAIGIPTYPKPIIDIFSLQLLHFPP